ncbi:alkaline-phosphatase-like protein [Pseudoneurospora amorphoporcata]|uniref:Alkaline-phosphatase-like protein n=1 Tax=Pseudoneurospora amorphoporcata TaxID=241081 RepID=A0AAN6P3C0_9PEZI|nr:alkaline-phosphatase-like protein [Pseudoneurospora amorphoporcata]
MSLRSLNTTTAPAASRDRSQSLLSPSDYDADAVSIRSEQDTDSEDDERQLRARNSRELLAHDRLVLMEEEELEQMVTETRRKQELERTVSNLPIPNPLRMLARRMSDVSPSRSRSSSSAPGAWMDDLVAEKRNKRRQRRQAKRDRLLAKAQHGEDGELMYEMEEGGMKDGSSTGDSSDREDSDDVDRRGLLHFSDVKARRKRDWCRWILIYAMILVAFAILFLTAWKLSLKTKRGNSTSSRPLVSNGTAMFAPTTIIFSLDGFRADFLNRGLTPRLSSLIKEGVSPLYMLPSFPSVTFPNHYTLATGLYPEAHGVVGNTFWDPTLKEEFYYTDPARSLDPKWWRGEPFWVSAQKQGLKTAIHMWPGSEAHVLDVEPTYMDRYNGKEKLGNKVDRILGFLDMPDDERPQVIAAYVPNVDSDGHKYGPNSTEIRSTIEKVDRMMDKILKGLEERHLTNIVNVIVVSDHGMATTDISRLVQLEDLVDLSKIEHTDGWPLVGLRPKNPDDLQGIYTNLVKKTKINPNLEVYLRDVNMPERYHFSNNERIAPLWIVPKAGWALVNMKEMNLKEAQAQGAVYHPRGLHGYDHEHPLMRAIFIARGPAFPHKANSRIEAFQNIEVYNILCDSVGISPAPNNGTLRLPLKPLGLHSDEPGAGIESPIDPVTPYTLTASATPLTTSSTVIPTTVFIPVSAQSVSTDTATSAVTSAIASAKTSSTASDLNTPSPNQPSPQPTDQPPEGNNGTDGNDPSDGKSDSKTQNFWDWFTGKVSKWWGKVANSGKDDKSDEKWDDNSSSDAT